MKNSKSILKRQKLRKKKQQWLFFGIKWSAIILTALLGCYGLWRASGIALDKITLLFAAKQPGKKETALRNLDLKIEVTTNSDAGLDSVLISEIQRKVRQFYTNGDHDNLTAISREIYENPKFSRVTVTQFSKELVSVHVKQRKPVAIIDADNVRYLSDDLEIYGIAGKDDKLLLLKGFYEKDFAAKIGVNHWQINEETQKNLTIALEIYNLTVKSNIMIKEIDFDRYRGYSVALDNQPTTITLGNGDFEGKLTRLKSILESMEKEGKQASNIELDYSDKAFIKEIKL